MIEDERCQHCEHSRDDKIPEKLVLCKKCYLHLVNDRVSREAYHNLQKAYNDVLRDLPED